MATQPQVICSSCGGRTSKTETPGSFGVELLLWLFMCLPGLIYSIWRISARKVVCGSCGATTLIPINSPMGQKLLKDLGQG